MAAVIVSAIFFFGVVITIVVRAIQLADREEADRANFATMRSRPTTRRSTSMKRTSALISLGLVLAMAAGCAQELKRIRRGFNCCVFTALGVGAVAFLVYFPASLNEGRERTRQQRIQSAPRECNRAARELGAWVQKCHHILLEDARHRQAYGENSSSSKARAKSLLLIQEAQRHATLIHENDITRLSSQTVATLASMRDCCERCREHNKGKKLAECLILSLPQNDSVDLEFQTNTEEEETPDG